MRVLYILRILVPYFYLINMHICTLRYVIVWLHYPSEAGTLTLTFYFFSINGMKRCMYFFYQCRALGK